MSLMPECDEEKRARMFNMAEHALLFNVPLNFDQPSPEVFKMLPNEGLVSHLKGSAALMEHVLDELDRRCAIAVAEGGTSAANQQTPTFSPAQVDISKGIMIIQDAAGLTKNLGKKIGDVAKRTGDKGIATELMEVKTVVDTITTRLEWYRNPKVAIPAFIAFACAAASLIAALLLGAPIVVPIALGAAAVGFGVVAVRNHLAHKNATSAAPPVIKSA